MINNTSSINKTAANPATLSQLAVISKFTIQEIIIMLRITWARMAPTRK